MTALASRAAGARLLGIILVLLIPILLLSFLRIEGHRQTIAFTEKELAGVAVSDAVTRSPVGIASGEQKPADLRKQLAAVAGPARTIGAENLVDALSLAYSFPVMDKSRQVRLTAETLHEIGVRSNLTLDSTPEATFLAIHTIMNMPALVQDFEDFRYAVERSVDTAGIDQEEFKTLLVLIGRLAATIDEGRQSLKHAREASKTPEVYATISPLFEQMAHDVKVTIDVVREAQPGTEPLVLTMLARQNFDAADMYRQVADTWRKTSTRLQTLLIERREMLVNRLYVQIGLSLFCVLLGAGAALWMFAKTLKRLDMVQAEKKRADLAREESEVARNETERINGEVADLNRNLAEKIRLLGEAQDEIVKKGRMEQMGQLTATIAHELRNPLGAVRTSAFLVEKKTRGLNLGIEPQLQRINNGIQRCDNIITQLLDYSRNKPLQCRPGNLDEWLSRVVSEEAAKLPQSVMIELVLGLNDREVPFDEARLHRAVINLMANAVEAMTTGLKKEAGEGADNKIWISTQLGADETVVITVRDNGPGIPAEIIDKVREPLFTTKSFGTGLGVPAIEQIARQHGGRLKISSKPGEGASFEFILPLRQPGTESAHAA